LGLTLPHASMLREGIRRHGNTLKLTDIQTL
jgi:hypothetical protein